MAGQYSVTFCRNEITWKCGKVAMPARAQASEIRKNSVIQAITAG